VKKNNIWILFEERPKVEVIEKILNIYLEKNKSKFVNNGLRIIPEINNNEFKFLYKIENFKIEGINNIFLLLVSGYSSFVDFLLFRSENKPGENFQLKNCLYAIEETKTDSSESRNTAAGQRGTKFLFVEYYGKLFNQNLDKVMLYNAPETQNKKEASSVKFIKKCLKTTGVKFYGDYSDLYSQFNEVDEVITEKNSIKKPPKGNTPIRIKKENNKIKISGILSKPTNKGNIGHDPNQGQLITISNTLRKLGWNKKIEITKHKVSQSYVNRVKGNKFLYAMRILKIDLEKIDTPIINLPKHYWHYEKSGEKVATILLHTICNYLNLESIYENHAGSERGYFYSKNRDGIVVNKKYRGRNINLPDYVFADVDNKQIIVCEGEMFKNYNKGVKQIEGFDIFIRQYIQKYYSNYNIIKSLVLSDGKGTELKDNVIFQLNSNGRIGIGKKLPQKIVNFLNEYNN
jgi:hypothetical protein|tara:strand:- start:1072 stop:2451 length:1380 start_codon:yes stop_codon:yes gene_type:complete